MVMFSNTDCHEEEEDWDMLVQTSTNEQNAYLLFVQQFLQMEEEDQVDQHQMFISGFDETEECFETHEQRERRRNRHKSNPRNKRRKFDHARAYECIMQDYLGINPLFNDGGFAMMFHISRTRFQGIMEDVASLQIPYYHEDLIVRGKAVCCLQAKLLLPLKCIAYGNAPHVFSDYFQMSRTMASNACSEFDKIMHRLYSDEYVRVPTSTDLKNVAKVHEETHGVKGMFGNLDCCHMWWKNCPKAWQGGHKGKEGVRS